MTFQILKVSEKSGFTRKSTAFAGLRHYLILSGRNNLILITPSL